MNSLTLEHFLVAIAISIPNDEAAFSILKKGVENEFMEWYAALCKKVAQENGEDMKPRILPSLIRYLQETMSDDKASNMHMSMRTLNEPKTQIEIVDRVLSKPYSDLITELAQRPTCKEAVRSALVHADKMNMKAAIYSTRFDQVFSEFIEFFREHNPLSFQFTGEFTVYVMNCFTSFFYKKRTRDIWRILRQTDVERREVETKLTSAVEVKRYKTDDMVIRPLAINIITASKEAFNNAGQYDYSHGVKYDFYYMVMLELCRDYIDKMNQQLEKFYGRGKGYRVVLIDECDFTKERAGVPAVSNIASKIKNAHDVVAEILKQITSTQMNLDNLMHLRDQCFARGNNDSENKIWITLGQGGEASRYIDGNEGLLFKNYTRFDIILKGVLSAYTLMKELEDHGRFIVDTYDKCPTLFLDLNLPRSIDRLSSLDRIDMILKYQNDNCPKMIKGERGALVKDTDEGGELLTFEGMLNDYAGSPDSQHGQAPKNRRKAEISGFQEETNRKKAGKYQSSFQQLCSVCSALSAIPTSYMDYLRCKKRNGEEYSSNFFDPAVELSPSDIVAGNYGTLYSNYYFLTHDSAAQYYLQYINPTIKRNPVEAKKAEEMLDLRWSLGSSLVPCQLLLDTDKHVNMIALYIPMIDEYAIIPADANAEWDGYVKILPQYDVINDYIKEQNNLGHSYVLLTASLAIPPAILKKIVSGTATDDGMRMALEQSISFNPFIGFSNLASQNIRSMVDSLPVYPKYKNSVDQYLLQLNDVSILQHSLVQLFRMMFSFGVYCTKETRRVSTKDKYSGAILIRSLLSSEFKKDNLDWFFENLMKAVQMRQLVEPNTVYGTPIANSHMLDMQPIDLNALYVIFGQFDNCTLQSDICQDLKQVLQPYNEVADRFVYLFNYICSKASFLQILKDSYGAIFLNKKVSISELCCEMNTQLGIETTLNAIKGGRQTNVTSGVKYASIDTVSNNDMLRFLSNVSESSYKSFDVLCDELLKYIGSCKSEISALLDYNVSSQSGMEDKFRSCGSMFYLAGVYTDPDVTEAMNKIHEVTSPDTTGFLMSKGRYFTSVSGKETYYIHYTGQIAVVTNGVVEPVRFDFSSERDKAMYLEILANARS